MSHMNRKQFWIAKEETLVNLIVKIAKEKKDVSEYDKGWYAGQLNLVRKILKNMDLRCELNG